MVLRSDPISYPPRGLSRLEAARYIGVGPDKFDEMVADRRMPKPREIDRRIVWDRIELDMAFTELPYRGRANALDQAFGIKAS
jgi:predicted DNA-binding transcriptional regulator AlpA